MSNVAGGQVKAREMYAVPGRLERGTSQMSETEILAHELQELKDQYEALLAKMQGITDGVTKKEDGLEEKAETLRRQIEEKERAIQEIVRANTLEDLRGIQDMRLMEDNQMNQELLAMHDDLKRGKRGTEGSNSPSTAGQRAQGEGLGHQMPTAAVVHGRRDQGPRGSSSRGTETAVKESRVSERVGPEALRAPSGAEATDRGGEVYTSYGNNEVESPAASNHQKQQSQQSQSLGKHNRQVPRQCGTAQPLGRQVDQACGTMELKPSDSRRRHRDADRHPHLAQDSPRGRYEPNDAGRLLVSGQRASLSPPAAARKNVGASRNVINVNLVRRELNDDIGVKKAAPEATASQNRSKGSSCALPSSSFPAGAGFRASRRRTRPRQLNLQLELAGCFSPYARQQGDHQGSARNATPRQQNVRQYQVMDKKFNVLMPTQYNTAAILAEKHNDLPPRPTNANQRNHAAVAQRTSTVMAAPTLQYSTTLQIDSREFDQTQAVLNAKLGAIAEPPSRSRDELGDQGRNATQLSTGDFKSSWQGAEAFAKNQDIENVTNGAQSKDRLGNPGKKYGSVQSTLNEHGVKLKTLHPRRLARLLDGGGEPDSAGAGRPLGMTRNDTEGPRNGGGSSVPSDHQASPRQFQSSVHTHVDQENPLKAAQIDGQHQNPELKTIFSHKIDIKYNKNISVNHEDEQSNHPQTEDTINHNQMKQQDSQIGQVLKSQGTSQSMAMSQHTRMRPSNIGQPISSLRPAIILVDKCQGGHEEPVNAKSFRLSNGTSKGDHPPAGPKQSLEPNHAYIAAGPDLVAGMACTSRDRSEASLPLIPTSAKAARATNPTPKARSRNPDKTNYIGSFAEMPMQYNNAFHNSFYNTQLEKLMQVSRASRGSKRSLLFSPKTAAGEARAGQARGAANTVAANAHGGGPLEVNDDRIKILLQEQQMINENKAQNRATSRGDNQRSSSDVEKKLSQGNNVVDKSNTKPHTPMTPDDTRLAHSAAQRIPPSTNQEYFEQHDQILTNKFNHYYKQLKSREKDQSIVISHPYDLSHMVNTQKCFLTSNMLKHKQNMQMDRQKGNIVRTAGHGAQRHYYQSSQPYRRTLQPSDVTPRQRKEEWIRKAAEGKEQQLLAMQRQNQGQRIKSLFDYAQTQKYTLQADRAKIFDKSQQPQTRQGSCASGSPKPGTGQGRDSPALTTLPSRNTPKVKRDIQLSGYVERRDIMNIQQAKPLNPAPLPGQGYFMNQRNDEDRQSMLRGSAGRASFEAANRPSGVTSRGDRGQEQRSSQRVDNSSVGGGRQSPMYCVIATDRSNPNADKILEHDEKFLRGGESGDSQDPGTKASKGLDEETSHLRDVGGKSGGGDAAKGHHRQNWQTIVLQNQRDSHEGLEDSVQTTEEDRQAEHPAQATLGSSHQKHRLVAYSSLGSGTKGEPQQNCPGGNKEDQQVSGMVGSGESNHKDGNRSPRYLGDLGGSSPRGFSTSANAAVPHASISFGNSAERPHLQGPTSRRQRENQEGFGVNARRNHGDLPKLNLVHVEQGGSFGGLNGPSEVSRGDRARPQPQRTKAYTLVKNSPRLSSPGSNQGLFTPRGQSSKRQTLGRKQIGGYAGGVIGSAVDASLYHSSQAPGPSKKRPFTKQVHGERKTILYNHLEAVVSGQCQQEMTQKTLAIESPPTPTRRATEKREGVEAHAEAARRRKLLYETLELKGQGLSDQGDFDTDNRGGKNPTTPRDGKPITKIQLTQRNNHIALSPHEASLYSVAGGRNGNVRASPKAAGDDEGASQSQPANTNRSFKMDDILFEMNPDSPTSGRRGPNTVIQDHALANQGQKEEKFKPLNMKEIQMQISNEEYASMARERKFGENDFVKKRSSNALHSMQPKKRGQQRQRQPYRKERSKDAYSRDGELLQDDYSEEKPLDPWIIEFLRQKTLYKMQRDLWKVYEAEWQKFTCGNHLTARAPIPPNCRVLTLHVYLNENRRSISSFKNSTQVPIDAAAFSECHREAKRRLQMCSFRIIDENVFIEMKNEMNEGYQVMVSGSHPEIAPQRRQILGQNSLIVEYPDGRRIEVPRKDTVRGQNGIAC